MTSATGRPTEDRNRWGAIAGLVFFVLFVAGFMLSTNTPEYDDSDREWVDWFDDGGHRAQQVVGMLLLIVAALALVCFLAVLTRRLRATNRPELVNVAIGAGLVLAAMVIVSAIGINQVSASVTFASEDHRIPNADVLRQAESIGFGAALLGGGWSAALLVGATSLAARGTNLFPRWLVIASHVVAVLLLASLFFIPLVLLPLWVLAVSIVMLRSPAPA